MTRISKTDARCDPATLPVSATCRGCGAQLRGRFGEPGTRILFHPAPLCSHLLAKLAAMGLAPDPAVGFAFSDAKREP